MAFQFPEHVLFSFFKSRKESRQLDNYLTRYLAGTYQMSAEETDKLHFVTTTESLASRKVTMFRIFDPQEANGSAEALTYGDLDNHRASLKFEGRFAPDKTVTEIKDLRNTD